MEIGYQFLKNVCNIINLLKTTVFSFLCLLIFLFL